MDLYYKVKREEGNNLIQEDCLKSSRTMKSGAGPERRLKRQIANSNERKRMQTINAGFQSLRLLLPTPDERLSKAAILQQAVEYITHLLVERQQLLKKVTTSPESRQTSPITATVYPQITKYPKTEPLTLRNVAVTTSSNLKTIDIDAFRRKEKIIQEDLGLKIVDGENKMLDLTTHVYENTLFDLKSNSWKEQRVPHPESDIFLATTINSSAEFLLNTSTNTLLSNAQNILLNSAQNELLNSIIYSQSISSNTPQEITYSQSNLYTHPNTSQSNMYTLTQLNVQAPSTLLVQPESRMYSQVNEPEASSFSEPSSIYNETAPVFLAPSNGCSLSRRNLETIFEAIRHLEGGDGFQEGLNIGRAYTGHSEESGHESCNSDDEIGEPKRKTIKTGRSLI